MPSTFADVQKADDPDSRQIRQAAAALADEMDLVRRRARILSPDDRALVLLYLDNGRSFAEVAQLAGVCDATVARRVGRIIRRLMDGQYITCLRHRDRLGPLGLAIAKDYLIDGFPVHAIAVRNRTTVYRVRKTLNTIRRLLHESAAARGTGILPPVQPRPKPAPQVKGTSGSTSPPEHQCARPRTSK